MKNALHTRRRFLGEAACAAVGSASVLSTMLNLQMANHAAAVGSPGSGQRKTLVCLHLSGGWDSYNVLIPYAASAASEADDAVYAEYKAARSNLAIPRQNLLPLTGLTDAQGRNFGLHPNCKRMAEMFNGPSGSPYQGKKRLSLIANVGTLVEPISNKSEYYNATKALPKALFSHRDQTEQWQTSVPQGLDVLTGWAGRAADVLHSTFNTEQTGGFYMPMSFSLSGNSAFQTGAHQGQFVLTHNGAISLTGANNPNPPRVLAAKNAAISEILGSPLDSHYKNLLQQSFANITRDSIARGATFQAEFDRPGSVNGVDVIATLDAAGFPDYLPAANLRAAVQNLAIRESLKLCRQTIFIEWGGWDHHGELLNTQAEMLSVLDDSLYAYQNAIEALGLQDDVITFTSSDFGRTLRSNGQGTDHAWSGHQLVLGGPIDGGKLLGRFPSLEINGVDDIGRGGRLFPRLSCDEYFCELLRWFGVNSSDMDQVLPNITNFYNPGAANHPIGFLA